MHATVRRATGSGWAGVLAGVAMATTPVAVLMFRFDNPDALLTLLLTGGGVRRRRGRWGPSARLRWLVLGGALVGLAFLTKTLQAFLVLPGLALAYALFAAVPWRRRIAHLLAAFGAMLRGRRRGGSRSSSWCRRRCGPTSAARRTTRSSS